VALNSYATNIIFFSDCFLANRRYEHEHGSCVQVQREGYEMKTYGVYHISSSHAKFVTKIPKQFKKHGAGNTCTNMPYAQMVELLLTKD